MLALVFVSNRDEKRKTFTVLEVLQVGKVLEKEREHFLAHQAFAGKLGHVRLQTRISPATCFKIKLNERINLEKLVEQLVAADLGLEVLKKRVSLFVPAHAHR
jgi:hypothetical protein